MAKPGLRVPEWEGEGGRGRGAYSGVNLLSLLAAFVLNDCEWVGEKDGWRWLTCELLRCLTSIVIAAQWGEVGSEGSEGSDGDDDSENNHANDAYT